MACSAVAVLATVISAVGGYASPTAFVDGTSAAVWVGAVMVGLAAVAALAIPGRKVLALRREEETAVEAEELEVERVA